MKKPKWIRNVVHLGDDWHSVQLRRSRFNKNKIKGKIEDDISRGTDSS